MTQRRHRAYATLVHNTPAETPNLDLLGTPVPLLPEPLQEILDPYDPDVDFIIDAIRHMRFIGFDVEDPDVLLLAVRAARRKSQIVMEEARAIDWEERKRLADEHAESVRAAIEDKATTYYMRIGNRVKIGYSTNLDLRMRTFNPEELLATEPGGRVREAALHRQFASLRTAGEWFRYESPLVEHVEQVKKNQAGRRLAC